MMLNLNEFSREVYQVAVEHGWYENDECKSEDAKIALIHAELSEALEEYRNRKPMVYFHCCNLDGVDVEVCDGGNAFGDCEKEFPCPYRDEKPEGIMIELIDACIRIFDFMGYKGWCAPDFCDTTEKLIHAARAIEYSVFDKYIENLSIPELVRLLHWYISQYNMDEEMADPMHTLLEVAGLIFMWIKEHGREPDELLRMKHEYNKQRPYKHGGKRI